jgi:hypothetical protein
MLSKRQGGKQCKHSVSDVPYGETPTNLGKLTDPSILDSLGLRRPSSPTVSTATLNLAPRSLACRGSSTSVAVRPMGTTRRARSIIRRTFALAGVFTLPGMDAHKVLADEASPAVGAAEPDVACARADMALQGLEASARIGADTAAESTIRAAGSPGWEVMAVVSCLAC